MALLAWFSLMHGNNEIGTMIDLQKVGEISHNHNALFHSDTVQTIGHFEFDLASTPIDFITASAHKFHGPKGVGFLYIDKNVKVGSLISGGSQERNLRGGTENILGIAGMHRALVSAHENLVAESHHIQKPEKAISSKN
jgi:cysteine desulfurase